MTCKIACYVLTRTMFSSTLSCQTLILSLLYLHWRALILETIVNSISVPHRIYSVMVYITVNSLLNLKSGKMTKWESYTIQSQLTYLSDTFQLTECHCFNLWFRHNIKKKYLVRNVFFNQNIAIYPFDLDI